MINSSIIELIKERKQSAFKLMYQKSIAYVYSIVRRYVTNESEHADVIQEIYARVFLSIDTYDESKSEFKYWLRRLVINQCLQHYRQGKSPRLYVSIDAANEIDTGEERHLYELSKAEVENYLSQMPEGYRQIFMLVVMDGFSHKEVSEQLGISVETSRSQLSRAKSWIQKKILRKNEQKALVNGL